MPRSGGSRPPPPLPLLRYSASREPSAGEKLTRPHHHRLERGDLRHDHDEARSAFEETRTLALERGNAYDAALVSLDLARVHLDRFDLDALREEAKAIIPVLAAEGLHEEAGAALLLYRDTLLTGRLEQGFVNRLARYLEAARRDPGLRFRTS